MITHFLKIAVFIKENQLPKNRHFPILKDEIIELKTKHY